MSKYIYSQNLNDNTRYVAHYGVKGMKWHKHLFGDKPETANEAYSRMQREKAISDFKEAAGRTASNISGGLKRARGDLKRTSTSIQRGVNSLRYKGDAASTAGRLKRGLDNKKAAKTAISKAKGHFAGAVHNLRVNKNYQAAARQGKKAVKDAISGAKNLTLSKLRGL